MLEVVRDFSPRVEYYSIDEFFFEVPAGRSLARDGRTTARRHAARGRRAGHGRHRPERRRWPSSSPTRPSRSAALALLDRAAERALLERLPVTEISGIASRRAARLAPHGIATCLELARADRRLVRQLLTITGEALWYELNGEAVFPFYTERPPHKMLSRGGSLGGAVEQPERMLAWLARNVERLVEELEFHVVRTGALSVYILHKDGSEGFARMLLPAHTDRFDLLMEAARPALGEDVVGGSAGDTDARHRQPAASSRLRAAGLVRCTRRAGCRRGPAQREVNAEMGRFALRSGATLPLADVYRDEAQSYDICDVRGKICF